MILIIFPILQIIERFNNMFKVTNLNSIHTYKSHPKAQVHNTYYDTLKCISPMTQELLKNI